MAEISVKRFNGQQNSTVTELTDNTQEEVLMLHEDDIPGASLNGRDPSETRVKLEVKHHCRYDIQIKD